MLGIYWISDISLKESTFEIRKNVLYSKVLFILVVLKL